MLDLLNKALSDLEGQFKQKRDELMRIDGAIEIIQKLIKENQKDQPCKQEKTSETN